MCKPKRAFIPNKNVTRNARNSVTCVHKSALAAAEHEMVDSRWSLDRARGPARRNRAGVPGLRPQLQLGERHDPAVCDHDGPGLGADDMGGHRRAPKAPPIDRI